MTMLGISAAHRQWGISRSYLYALRDKGKLSFSTFPDGRPGIDSAELLRVLGEPKGQTAPDGQRQDWTAPETGQAATADSVSPVLSELQAQLEVAQRALAELKDNERQALEAQLEAALDREK